MVYKKMPKLAYLVRVARLDDNYKAVYWARKGYVSQIQNHLFPKLIGF